MNLVHLTSSTFHGGPERQMLGLAQALPEEVDTHFLSFPEGGRCRGLLSAARQSGFEAHALEKDTPRFFSAITEIAGHLERCAADVLFCHGYKANLLGRPAARRRGIPAVAVSRGWTGETWKVRLYEWLDRRHLGWMDRVVCVSEAQAAKVRKCGVRPARVEVIPNAVDVERFADPEPLYRQKLARYFRQPKSRIVAAAGRLSPEKGFDVFLLAAERVLRSERDVGFVIFGEGPCRAALVDQITGLGLTGSVALVGFRTDLDRFLPFLDLFVLSSHTEGMPNVVLESFAAGVPVVATAVGGTPEVVEDGASGYLVPPGDAAALADRIVDALSSEEHLRDMGLAGRQRVVDQFGFAAQADRYLDLIEALTGAAPPKAEEVIDAEVDEPADAKPDKDNDLVSAGPS
jgi:glycosyltransferase involved in cell wall biosynthesis